MGQSSLWKVRYHRAIGSSAIRAMHMRLQRWSFEVKYKKGAQQVIADTLSRAPLPQLSTASLSGEQIF